MVAFNYNAQQYEPSYGGGNSPPPGEKYKVAIVKTEGKPAKSNPQNSYLALSIQVIEGPHKGSEIVDRLNLFNTDTKTVEIANKQLSAYCHVTGVYNIQDTDQLCNIPFLIDVRLQSGENPNNYVEVAKLYNLAGQENGRGSPQGQQQPQGGFNQPPPGNVQPGSATPPPPQGFAQPPQGGQGGGFAQPGQGGSPQVENGPPPPQEQQQQPSQGQGFGQPQPQGFGQSQQQQPPQGGWSPQGGQQGGGDAGGWANR